MMTTTTAAPTYNFFGLVSENTIPDKKLPIKKSKKISMVNVTNIYSVGNRFSKKSGVYVST